MLFFRLSEPSDVRGIKVNMIHSYEAEGNVRFVLFQTRVSLKAMFPQSPSSLLLPLLTRPSEVPQEARRRHLNWLSGSLQRLAEEEEEEEEGDGDNGTSLA